MWPIVVAGIHLPSFLTDSSRSFLCNYRCRLNWGFQRMPILSITTPRAPSSMARVYLKLFFSTFFTSQTPTLAFTCCSVTPPFSFRVPSAVFSQLLPQLSSLVFWQKALLVWSSHLFPVIMRRTEEQSPLKTISVASTPSLKWWLLLIPNLYFVSVSHVLNHNRSFLEFFQSLCAEFWKLTV